MKQPDIWLKLPIKAIAKLSTGGTPSRSNTRLFGGGIPWATPADATATNGLYIDHTTHTLSQDGLRASSAKLLLPGTVLMTSRATVGATVIASQPMATSQDFISFECDKYIVDNEYFALFLRNSIPEINRISSGTVFASVSQTSISRWEIALPPLSEQKFIVDILNQSEVMREQCRSATESVRAVLLRLFEQTFLRHPSAKDWPVITVGEAGEVQLGRQRSPQYQTGRYTKPYLRVANVLEDEIDFSDILEMDFDRDDLKRYRLEFGDILLNEGQGSKALVGRPAMWREQDLNDLALDQLRLLADCCFQNTLIRFRANSNTTHPEYALSLFLKYLADGVFARASVGIDIAHLGAERFAKLPFPLPPLELQEEYARQVAAVRETLRKIRAARVKTLSILEKLSALAFTGALSARWREANQEMLRGEAAERDRYLNMATVAKNGASAGHLSDEIEASTITDLSKLDLLQPLHSRPGFWQDVDTDSPLHIVYNALRGAPGGLGTSDTIHDLLSEQEGAELTEDEIERALEVLAATGILLPLTLEVPDPSNPDATICFDAYRLLSNEDNEGEDSLNFISAPIDEQRNTQESENRFADTTSIGVAR